MPDLVDHLEAVRTRDDFVAFVGHLREDLWKHSREWENADLGSFLEAVQAWTQDADATYASRGEVLPDPPDWNFVAVMLYAASMYE